MLTDSISFDSIKIQCINLKQTISADGGESLDQIADKYEKDLGFKPICAHVNNKTESLTYRIFSPKMVEFLSVYSSSGSRTYLRSLCMVLYKAVVTLYPGARLRMEHSVSRGYYCEIDGAEFVPTQENVDALKAEMKRIVADDLVFERRIDLTKNVINIFAAQGLEDKVNLLKTTEELYTTYYRLDGLCDSYYGTLAPSTGILQTFNLVPYKKGMLLLSFDPTDKNKPATPIVQDKLFDAFTQYSDFNKILGIHNVGELNRDVQNGNAPMLISLAEALHEKYLARISDEIARRYNEGGARIVLIAGPSSSGKTTTTKRLAIQLMTNLLRPEMMSLDDYFVNRSETPRDASGDFDYESLHALDLKQFNTDLQSILAGEDVEIPSYNFERGCREYKGKHIKLADRGILLIEGIHGLNPELTTLIPEQQKFRIYVSALTTISIDDHNWVPTTDNRLLRRIIRDYKYRGVSAIETIRRWPSVRRGEERWIFPYQENADAMFNSSLIFELSVMKNLAEKILLEVPHNVPEYAEAYRLRKFISYFLPIQQYLLPHTSLLREFLGGSSFHY